MSDVKATNISPQDVVKQAQGALGQALNAIATLSEQGLTGLEGVKGEIQNGQATLNGLSSRLDDHDKQFNSMQEDIADIKRLVEGGANIEVDLNGQEYSVDIGELEPSNIEVHYQIGGKSYVAQMEKNNLTGPFLSNSNIKDQKANLHFSEALDKLEIKSKGGGIFDRDWET